LPQRRIAAGSLAVAASQLMCCWGAAALRCLLLPRRQLQGIGHMLRAYAVVGLFPTLAWRSQKTGPRDRLTAQECEGVQHLVMHDILHWHCCRYAMRVGVTAPCAAIMLCGCT
jgi:hypothetical protein